MGAGDGFMCGLSDGTLLPECWGADVDQQISGTPLQALAAISVQGSRACGILLETSAPICWGANAADATAPAGARLAFISTGAARTCGIDADTRRAVCWGGTSLALCPGHGAELALRDAELVAIAVGDASVCGIQVGSRRVLCWAACAGSGRLAAPPPFKRFESVVVGVGFACGLELGTSRPFCWGQADIVGKTPTESAMSFIDAQGAHVCGIRRLDGSPVCWGADAALRGPSPPGHERFARAVVGRQYACGLTSAGALLCWGRGVPEAFRDLPPYPAWLPCGGDADLCSPSAHERSLAANESSNESSNESWNETVGTEANDTSSVVESNSTPGLDSEDNLTTALVAEPSTTFALPTSTPSLTAVVGDDMGAGGGAGTDLGTDGAAATAAGDAQMSKEDLAQKARETGMAIIKDALVGLSIGAAFLVCCCCCTVRWWMSLTDDDKEVQEAEQRKKDALNELESKKKQKREEAKQEKEKAKKEKQAHKKRREGVADSGSEGSDEEWRRWKWQDNNWNSWWWGQDNDWWAGQEWSESGWESDRASSRSSRGSLGRPARKSSGSPPAKSSAGPGAAPPADALGKRITSPGKAPVEKVGSAQPPPTPPIPQRPTPTVGEGTTGLRIASTKSGSKGGKRVKKKAGSSSKDPSIRSKDGVSDSEEPSANSREPSVNSGVPTLGSQEPEKEPDMSAARARPMDSEEGAELDAMVSHTITLNASKDKKVRKPGSSKSALAQASGRSQRNDDSPAKRPKAAGKSRARTVGPTNTSVSSRRSPEASLKHSRSMPVDRLATDAVEAQQPAGAA